jgi:hypothetical protein
MDTRGWGFDAGVVQDKIVQDTTVRHGKTRSCGMARHDRAAWCQWQVQGP